MSLKYVLLVVLKKQKSTGYEINKWFEGPLGYFWDTSHQRVYRALAKMNEDGLVCYETEHQSNKPDKKIYQITKAGRETLDQWMRTPLPPTPENEPFLVKLFAADTKYLDSLIKELEMQLESFETLYNQYKTIEKHFDSYGEIPSQMAMIYLTLKRGIKNKEASIEWAKEALEVLRNLKPGSQ